MADNKKSFVLYSDLENQIDLLTDDEAGRLFRHILAYVNDRNPEFKQDDRLLAVSFEPIKQQLKRDLIKYEKIKTKRAEAGRKGGMATQNKGDLTKSSAKETEANQANASMVKQTEANQADNVNVNVNVNGNGNVIKDKEIDKEKTKTFSYPTSSPAAYDFKKMEEVMNSILEDQNTLLEIGGVAKIPNPKDIPELIREFFRYQKLAGKIHQDSPNFKKHFVTWYSRRYPNNASEKQKNNELPPDRSGEFDKERIGKWMWLNNDWRDTTTFAEHRKQHYGIK